MKVIMIIGHKLSPSCPQGMICDREINGLHFSFIVQNYVIHVAKNARYLKTGKRDNCKTTQERRS